MSDSKITLGALNKVTSSVPVVHMCFAGPLVPVLFVSLSLTIKPPERKSGSRPKSEMKSFGDLTQFRSECFDAFVVLFNSSNGPCHALRN